MAESGTEDGKDYEGGVVAGGADAGPREKALAWAPLYVVGARVRFYEDGEVRDAGTVTEVCDEPTGTPYRVKWDEAPFSTYDQWYRADELVSA
jgi:hypothetical protein